VPPAVHSDSLTVFEVGHESTADQGQTCSIRQDKSRGIQRARERARARMGSAFSNFRTQG
jgi:hypothetical protein